MDRHQPQRLGSLGWFMKCLKEPLSRLADREEEPGGAFFEGRSRSVAVLDDESLLAVCAYIDLDPVAASVAEVPEAGKLRRSRSGSSTLAAGPN